MKKLGPDTEYITSPMTGYLEPVIENWSQHKLTLSRLVETPECLGISKVDLREKSRRHKTDLGF